MRAFLLPLFLLLLGFALPAQQCNGNLGENIFTDGDFGSGTANVLTPDPGIAPGFRYAASPPPDDGYYTITNDMGRWDNIFGTWIQIGDNSNDPNGYMMVVNASFEPGLFYEQVVDGLCENTLYQFTADIINVLRRGSNNLLPNVSFLIDDQEYFTTGFIPEDEQWKTYGFTFTTVPGQTSVTLALRNNAPGGFGNDLALDNISFRACGPEALILPREVANICEDGDPIPLEATINGDQFPTPAVQWQRSTDGGTTWTDIPGANDLTYQHTQLSSGAYPYRYLLANSEANLGNSKCQIISNTKVVNVVPKNYTLTDTICSGLSVTVGNSTYDQGGVYVDTLVSSLGCDSIVRLELTVVPDPFLSGRFTTQDPSCSYLTDGSVVLDSILRGRPPYTFTFDGLPRQIGSLIDSLGEGAYPYALEDRYGCRTSDTLQLTSPFPFVINLGENQEVVLGETVTVTVRNSQPITNYRWTPEGAVTCDSSCVTLEILPANSFTLGLEATSPDGCLASDSLRILVVADRLVYIPTAFSPDGDGSNDQFTVFGKVPNVQFVPSLKIFNRWGGEVYSATDLPVNDPSAGWDGLLNGQPVPPGTYVYVAEVAFLDGIIRQYSGSFVLIE
ncbi:gliding motility-associated C-terminal domain-containing protein [Neolewinella litorea]|uniref:Gliding motility-associated C-terminal domain-containing protein n=1 Tax=Neolewinella litorea TaxID=2562452 RepID=A0A4S4ND46_9BACT|nr:gliding motility-associated C-terminal domain-containing protein [Neolewinella litorea]THH36447.1 gliding motility-associated C-terminal domain-containing protein [Neolewinella litorea]